MNALCALTAGFGIGLASVAGLWLTICYALRAAHGRAALAVSQVLRLSLTVAGFYAVMHHGSDSPPPAVDAFLQTIPVDLSGSSEFSPSALMGEWNGVNMLSNDGGSLLLGLAGFWMARQILIHRWGAVRHAP